MIIKKDLSVLSSTLPEVPEPHVPRPFLVEQIFKTFSTTNRVVVVEGESSSGKTVLLTEFVLTYPNQCISFFTGADFWTSNPRYFLQECCNQMKESDSKFRDVEFEDAPISLIEQYFGRLYRGLSRQAVRSGKPFYFVIDALDRVSADAGQKTILDFIPTDPLDGIFVLASCTEDVTLEFDYHKIPMAMFSEAETQRYFSDLPPDKAVKIHSASRGMPGYLKVIKKKKIPTKDIASLIKNLPFALSALYDQVWQDIGTNGILKKVVAAICHVGVCTVATLSEILEEPKQTIIDAVTIGRQFIDLDTSTGIITIDDSFKNYALERPDLELAEMTIKLISFFESNRYDPEAIIHLPDLYSQIGSYAQLREFLSPDFIVKALG